MQTFFSNNQLATIVKTNGSLDGLRVRVTGIVLPALHRVGPAFYIVEREDGKMFQADTGEWKSIQLVGACLE